jgi:large subunit ribosomal protein L9
VTQKAGVDGRLFGSVTNADIAEGIKAQGFDVVKAQVRLPNGPLKHVGEFPVSVALHHDVVVDITVAVVGETD